MTPTLQTRFGNDGNCWPACLATIFDVPLSAVDHLAAHYEDWHEQTEAFLQERGLFQNQIEVKQDAMGRNCFPFIAPPEGTICVVVGKRWGASIAHAVVAKVKHGQAESPEQCHLEFEIIHDPLGEPKAFSVTESVIFFAKTFI